MVEQVSVLEMFRLDGQVSVVTGGSEWLGFDVASALAEAGSAVVITSRTQARAEAYAADLGARYGVDTLAVRADQNCPSEVAAAAARIHAWQGRIDVLVNNAGGGSGRGTGALLERDPEAAAALITANLTGVLHWCREAARHMLPAERGRIINIASIAGIVGRDRSMYHRNHKTEQPADYAAAKGGVIGLTLDLAATLSPRGIRVNAISPGGFDKGDLPEPFVKDYAAATMLGRMGRFGADLKGAALFLASAASDYVTGHNLVVDGGFSVWR
jgi:NAD(P)-dependent dehydrogenase (short-subunit alcohol dehydrogenase family)